LHIRNYTSEDLRMQKRGLSRKAKWFLGVTTMGGALAIGGFAHAALTSPSGFFINENTTIAGDVTSDLGAPVYSIVGGADQAKFSINPVSGRLSFIAAPNFEAPTDANSDNAYVVEVSDGPTFESVTVRVQNVNEAPVISGGTTATQAENTTVTGYSAGASDADAGDTLTYSFGGGADDALFNINVNTGVLSFRAAPNFETPLDAGADNDYVVDIEVTDGNLTDTETVTVTVTNVNEAPVYTGLTTATQNENRYRNRCGCGNGLDIRNWWWNR
jgi:VCBS repeat-containing protein